MVQKYFIDSWLLPCSLRSHRTANPRPKIGFAIFRLCPPTTRQAGGCTKFNDCNGSNQMKTTDFFLTLHP